MAASSHRRILAGLKPKIAHRDPDEDLHLFREIHKRERERIASLLQPVSEEFEPYSANDPLYRIASAKQVSGCEFHAGGNKNDYDWLKTPPATPLFPSLEMEAINAPYLVAHREIPILQPLSRFSGNAEASKEGNGTSSSANPKSKISPRNTASTGGFDISLATTKNPEGPLILNPKASIDPSNCKISNMGSNITSEPTIQQESNLNFLRANFSRNMGTDSKLKPTIRSRGVSPQVRTKITAQIPGFSDETPSNLKTDRSSSTSCGRSTNPVLSGHQKPDFNAKSKRQSCSPSMARNRKAVEYKQLESEGNLTSTRKGIFVKHQTANRAQVPGSRMVDKVMNARKPAVAEEKETKQNVRAALVSENTAAYCRMAPKSPLNTAHLKHMEMKGEHNNSSLASLRARSKTSSSTSH